MKPAAMPTLSTHRAMRMNMQAMKRVELQHRPPPLFPEAALKKNKSKFRLGGPPLKKA
jgi:hypothetical protein